MTTKANSPIAGHADRCSELAIGISQSDAAGLSPLQRARLLVELENIRERLAVLLATLRDGPTGDAGPLLK